MVTREKSGWLTAHALRSGLAEQWSTDANGTIVTVELRWSKTDGYLVTTMTGRQIDKRTPHDSLVTARENFTNEQRRATSPRERTAR
jgi:hypothetical protein